MIALLWGSLLSFILANTFMAELERSVILGLASKLSNLRRYVHDTIRYIMTRYVESRLH